MGVLQVRMRKLAVRSAVLVIFALSLPAWPQAAQPNATTLPAATRPHEAAQAFRFAVMTDTHIAAPADWLASASSFTPSGTRTSISS